MSNKAVTVQPILDVTEKRAKWRPVSGHSRHSHGRIEKEHRFSRPALAHTAQVSTAPTAAKRLLSWKEIAGYLKCNIRSVQRWERGEELPVHRHVHQKGSTVYAYSNELDAWLWTRRPLEASSVTPPNANAGGASLTIMVSGEGFVSTGSGSFRQISLRGDRVSERSVFRLCVRHRRNHRCTYSGLWLPVHC